MKTARVATPARLHFGLFGWGPEALRQFGGLGLMIQQPGLEVSAKIADEDVITAPPGYEESLQKLIAQVRLNLAMHGCPSPKLELQLEQAIPVHHGLGSGSQRALAVARLLALLAGYPENTLQSLADLAGRFPRSGVGAYGFQQGGLIVDGGHARGLGEHQALAPLVSRMHWPEHWRVVLIIPQEPQGTHGTEELQTFRSLQPPEMQSMNYVARATLTSFLPAVAEADFNTAMTTLEQVQKHVGQWFAPAQCGSIFGSPVRDQLVEAMKTAGLRGVGQSSWGPTLFGFSESSEMEIGKLIEQIKLQFPDVCLSSQITYADNHGHRITTIS